MYFWTFSAVCWFAVSIFRQLPTTAPGMSNPLFLAVFRGQVKDKKRKIFLFLSKPRPRPKVPILNKKPDCGAVNGKKSTSGLSEVCRKCVGSVSEVVGG
jgi:hypothetical protein